MQGHLPNGNPVQRHSAGEHYPYVIAIVETNGRDRRYRVVGPGFVGLWQFVSADRAEAFARAACRSLHAMRGL